MAGRRRAIAGGQSLMPMLAFRVVAPALLVDLRKLPELTEIRIGADGVRLGAMVRWRDILDDARLATAHPLLQAAVEHVAHYQIRNRGTVGGSIAHADPAAEMPGIAVTCDAEIAVVGSKGSRVIRADDFFVGALTTALEHDEIITEIKLPAWPAKRRWGFQRILAPPRRFRHGGGRAVLRSGRRRQGGQRPCRHHRCSAIVRAGCPRLRRRSTAAPSTRR